MYTFRRQNKGYINKIAFIFTEILHTITFIPATGVNWQSQKPVIFKLITAKNAERLSENSSHLENRIMNHSKEKAYKKVLKNAGLLVIIQL